MIHHKKAKAEQKDFDKKYDSPKYSIFSKANLSRKDAPASLPKLSLTDNKTLVFKSFYPF